MPWHCLVPTLMIMNWNWTECLPQLIVLLRVVSFLVSVHSSKTRTTTQTHMPLTTSAHRKQKGTVHCEIFPVSSLFPILHLKKKISFLTSWFRFTCKTQITADSLQCDAFSWLSACLPCRKPYETALLGCSSWVSTWPHLELTETQGAGSTPEEFFLIKSLK